MNFQEITEAEFKKFEEKQPQGNIMQMAERAKLRRKMGFECFFLGVKKDEDVIAAGLLVVRYGEGWIQIGPVMDYTDIKALDCFLEGTLDFAKEKGISEFEIFPPVLLSVRNVDGEKIKEFDQKKIFEVFSKYGFTHMGMTTEIEYKANRWMCVKDLTGLKDMNDVRATYKKNVRGHLKKLPEELEVHVLTDMNELADWATALDSSNEKNGVKSRNLDYYKWIWESFGDKVQFMVVRKKDDKKTVAARVVFYRPNEVVTFVSGTVQEYKKLNGMTLLQDWQIEECLKRGITRLNFYGLRGDFSNNNHLLEFKSGFGVMVEEYIGGFKIVLDPVKYNFGRVKRKIKTLFS